MIFEMMWIWSWVWEYERIVILIRLKKWQIWKIYKVYYLIKEIFENKYFLFKYYYYYNNFEFEVFDINDYILLFKLIKCIIF